jgi:hypothetical protein
MKKMLLVLAVLAFAVAVTQPCLAQPAWKKLNVGDPMRWVKYDSSGILTIDSTTVYIPYATDQTADNRDTTAQFDLASIHWPYAFASTDTSTQSIVLIGVPHWSSEATADTIQVDIQYSIDGTAWSDYKSVTLGGLSNVAADTWRRGNLGQKANGSLDYPIRYVRWIVRHIDKSTSTVRAFTFRPYWWSVSQ